MALDSQTRENMMKTRAKVVKELVETEKIFLNDLKLLSNVCESLLGNKFTLNSSICIQSEIMKPMEDPKHAWSKILTPAEQNTLFFNVRMIEVICQDLVRLEEQELAKSADPADAAIGSAFIAKKAALLASFSSYCSNSQDSLALYERFKKDKAFQQLLNDVLENPALGGVGLLSYIIKPVQRVTKYPLLLVRILESTPEDHIDRENTQQSYQAVLELVEQVNHQTRLHQNRLYILNLADQTTDWPDRLIAPNSNHLYLIDGHWTKISHGKRQERHFFLFSDLIVYSKVNVTGKKYSYKGFIPIAFLEFEDISDPQNGIKLTRSYNNMDTAKTYIICCKDPAQKKLWLEQLAICKSELQKTIRISTSVQNEDNADSNIQITPIDELLVAEVEEKISGWTNYNSTRKLLFESPLKFKVSGKECDYAYLFNDGLLGTKSKRLKNPDSRKFADFRIFLPAEDISFVENDDPSMTKFEIILKDDKSPVVVECETKTIRDQWISFWNSYILPKYPNSKKFLTLKIPKTRFLDEFFGADSSVEKQGLDDAIQRCESARLDKSKISNTSEKANTCDSIKPVRSARSSQSARFKFSIKSHPKTQGIREFQKSLKKSFDNSQLSPSNPKLGKSSFKSGFLSKSYRKSGTPPSSMREKGSVEINSVVNSLKSGLKVSGKSITSNKTQLEPNFAKSETAKPSLTGTNSVSIKNPTDGGCNLYNSNEGDRFAPKINSTINTANECDSSNSKPEDNFIPKVNEYAQRRFPVLSTSPSTPPPMPAIPKFDKNVRGPGA